MLRAFGLAPGTYRPEITTMTQKVDYNLGKQLDDDNDNDTDSDGARFDRLCVAKTYQREALPALAGCPKLQVEENKQIVTANFEACFEDEGVDSGAMDELLAKALERNHKQKPLPAPGANYPKHGSTVASSSQVSGILPNTQEVQEQAREQLEADREMQENSMEQEEEEEQLEKPLLLRPQKQQTENDPPLLKTTTPTTTVAAQIAKAEEGDDGSVFVLQRRELVVSTNSSNPLDSTATSNTENENKGDRNTYTTKNSKNHDAGSQSIATAQHEHGDYCTDLYDNGTIDEKYGRGEEVGTTKHGNNDRDGLFDTKTNRKVSVVDVVAGDSKEKNGKQASSTVVHNTKRDKKHHHHQSDRPHDVFDVPSPSSSQPPDHLLPTFARTDTGTKNLRHTRKSFSRYDRADSHLHLHPSKRKQTTPPPPSSIDAARSKEPFQVDASLSPIDHETSYWAEDSAVDPLEHKTGKSAADITGLMEDSRGGLHMMPLIYTNTNANTRDPSHSMPREKDNDVGGSAGGAASDEVENGGDRQEDGNNKKSNKSTNQENTDTDPNREGNDSDAPLGADGDDGSDKTIPMTADDAEESQETEQSENETDNSKNESLSIPGDEDDLANSKLTQVTEELHQSTKSEINRAATLPAGPKGNGRRQRPTKKALFEGENDDGRVEKRSLPDGESDPINYDPTLLTQVTEELHESTKTEINKAASLPAGPRPRGRTNKILFDVADDGRSKNIDLDKKLPAKDISKFSTRGTKNSNNSSSTEMGKTDETDELSSAKLPKGTIVRVQSRTWPGVNKQGGVGRIIAINPDSTYNVSYVLGGKEFNIDAVFVQKEDQGNDDSDGASGETKVRHRRRAKEDGTAELPEELLRQLAEEGFDIPGQKGGKKRKKNNRNAALSDTTNSGNYKREDRKNPPSKRNASSLLDTGTESKRKRKRASRGSDVEHADELQQTKLVTRRRRTTSREPLVKVERAILPKTSKKSTKQVYFEVKESKGDATDKGKSGVKNRISKVAPRGSNVSPIDFLLKISNEEAMKFADRRYQQKLQEAIDNKLIILASSNLKDEDKAILKSLCAKTFEGDLRIKMTETVNKKTTLCIVSAETKKGDDKTNIRSCVRTLKVMRSALAGIPIVTPDWLRSCYVETKVVSPQRFVRTMPTKNPEIGNSGEANYGAAKLAAAWNFEPKTPSLPFRNTFVYFCGSYTVDKRKNMQDLLKASGAKILLKPADFSSRLKSLVKSKLLSLSPSSRLVLLCGGSGTSLPKAVEKELKAALAREEHSPLSKNPLTNITVVDSQWVVESVTCAKPMPVAFFEPKIYKNLWKLIVSK